METFVWEKKLLPPSYACMVFHTNPLIFELSFNLSLTHLRAQIVCSELKVDWSPLMLKEIFRNSFENFETTRICMENHASVSGWQKFFFSYKCLQLWTVAVAIKSTFKIYGWKFLGYLFFILLFQLVLTKFSKVNCFRVYRKLITW